MDPAERPLWDGRPTMDRCDRWEEYSIRELLMRSNVPRAATSSIFRTFDLSASEELMRGTYRTMTGWAAKLRPRALLLSGPQRSGKTHLTVAALRHVRKTRPSLRVWYVHVPSLSSHLRDFFDRGGDSDPRDKIIDSKVVVLDGLSPRHEARWLRERLDLLIYQRLADELPTVFTTRESLAALTDAYTVASTLLGEVRECKLVT